MSKLVGPKDGDEEELSKFVDLEGGIHLTKKEMWQANAFIREKGGDVACMRMLDNPEEDEEDD